MYKHTFCDGVCVQVVNLTNAAEQESTIKQVIPEGSAAFRSMVIVDTAAVAVGLGDWALVVGRHCMKRIMAPKIAASLARQENVWL